MDVLIDANMGTILDVEGFISAVSFDSEVLLAPDFDTLLVEADFDWMVFFGFTTGFDAFFTTSLW